MPSVHSFNDFVVELPEGHKMSLNGLLVHFMGVTGFDWEAELLGACQGAIAC